MNKSFGLNPLSYQAREVPSANPFISFKKEEVEGSIPDRFEFIVSQNAERLAVKTKSYTLTYAALNKAANRVARAILAQGGAGEEPVALLLGHDAPMIVALLGVLKTGKIYVALDPAQPRARLAHILKDLKTRFIITNHKTLSLAQELVQGRYQLVNIDELDLSLLDDNLDISISPDNLAGIFYTSGSTGQPKGVMRNQRDILYRTWFETNEDQICADDKISLLYSCSFGASTTDIFNALLNGARLCLYDVRETGLVPLTNWLIQEEITFFHIPVAFFRQFLDTLTGTEKFPKLRQVTPSGGLFKADVERFRKHFPPACILINRLASSETGMVSRLVIDQKCVISSNVAPVGYPVPDKEVLILNETGEVVGFNQIGEIAVRSHYLSPGYWGKPELTRKAFSWDPKGGAQRIYRMGDLGRMRPDGCLEFLGRKDFQVKIRGYRVELSEVEAGLHNLDSVGEAVVVAQESQAGEQRLVAYVVPTSQPGPTTSSLRSALVEILPDYMIPAIFMVLDQLPLTLNGKLVRSALPAPGRTRPDLATSFVSPQTPLEETLADIWAQVLELEQVGIHDNFFDLGGHSLLATRITSRVLNHLQVELSPKTLFEAPTVAGMAIIIAQEQTKLSRSKIRGVRHPQMPNGAASEDAGSSKLDLLKLGADEELDRILNELENLSEEETQRLLFEESESDNVRQVRTE